MMIESNTNSGRKRLYHGNDSEKESEYEDIRHDEGDKLMGRICAKGRVTIVQIKKGKRLTEIFLFRNGSYNVVNSIVT